MTFISLKHFPRYDFVSLCSWPFAALIGAPIALDLIFRRRRLVFFIRWCVISVLTIFIPQVLFDTQFYGKLTIAPLNIVTYNIFTSHGPDLYGNRKFPFRLNQHPKTLFFFQELNPGPTISSMGS